MTERMAAGDALIRDEPALVSVVVPALNSAATLPEQLEALARQSYAGDWELVVADNGSTDETAEVVMAASSRLPGVRVVDASARAGSAHARNTGAAVARGALLCFIDADDVADPRWLQELVVAARQWDLVGGRLDTTTINEDHVQGWRPTPVTTSERQAQFAPSGNMAIWREAFEQLGGFNEEYLKSHDVELSRRAVQAGLRIGFAPDALVHYRLRATAGGVARQAYRGGRAAAQMAAGFPDEVEPPRPRDLAKVLPWAIVRLPYLLHRGRRGVWVRQVAAAAGTTVGLVRYRPAGPRAPEDRARA